MSDLQATNMLFIFSDQHTRRALGAMGHPLVKTPHMDRLAERGTLFRNAYCNGPICVPSRASLATGRCVHDIKKWDNCKPYLGEEPSWGHRLAAQGHVAGSIGKLHYRAESDPTGFDPQLLPLHILEGRGMLFTVCRDPLPVSKKFSHLVKTSGEGHSTYTRYDNDITQRAVEWIRTSGRNHDKPWAMFISLVCPHPPWNAPDPWYSMYPLEDIDLPTAYDLDKRPMHPGLEDYRQFFGVKDTFDEETLRRVIASYYGMISYLDDNLGQLVAALDETGLRATTRVLYTSDHGESMGQKGMFSKCNMFEESVGVPMILNGPDVPMSHAVDAPTQLLDVFPTILEATGAQFTDEDRELPGTSLLQMAHGHLPTRTILSEQHSAGARSAVFMLRQDNYKFVKYMQGYPSQLYDLENDPLELEDLGASSEHAQVLASCEAALRARLDPEAIDAEAKADQLERLAQVGGIDAVIAKGSPGYTPAPGETPEYM